MLLTLFVTSPTGPIVLGGKRGSDYANQLPNEPNAGGNDTESGATENTGPDVDNNSPETGTKSIGHGLSARAIDDLRKWEKKAQKFQTEGHLNKCKFESEYIPYDIMEKISTSLNDGVSVEIVFEDFISSEVVNGLHKNVTDLMEMVRSERGRRTAFQEV